MMNSSRYAVIAGSGSYLPTEIIPNSHFLNHQFFDTAGKKLDKSNEEIIGKFEEITGIKERRYVTHDLTASDIGFFAAEQALKSSHLDKETLDYIIFAHNFANISQSNHRSECVPSLASRVKQKLEIKNPKTIAYDIPFGCAGWLQGVIHANSYIKSGEANRILVIGAETLSRTADPHDRDSMIYSDGAGAILLEVRESDKPIGILSHVTETHANGHAFTIYMDKSNDPNYPEGDVFLKMHGHKLYEYALKLVPKVIQASIEKAKLAFTDISMLLIHQANQKMDTAILERLAGLYNISTLPKDIMPMTISWLGNSSVATVPTLYDLVSRGKLDHYAIKKNDIIVFAAVGAGININSVVYRVPE